jgi:hypothetical protein
VAPKADRADRPIKNTAMVAEVNAGLGARVRAAYPLGASVLAFRFHE